MGRNSLYYMDIVQNNLPSKKTEKVKTKQINKIELINKINLLKEKNKINLLKQTDKIKLWH